MVSPIKTMASVGMAPQQRALATQSVPTVANESGMPITGSAAQPQQATPQYGLGGFEQAVSGGLNAGINALQTGNQLAQQNLQSGIGALGGISASQVDPTTGLPLFQQAAQGVGAYSPTGLQAQNLQSALSGAQGQEAFDQALIDSPVQRFLREQGEQSRINQAAATGGLGGGEVQKELLRYGQGLAGTQLQQQIQNLQNLSGQGLQAAGQQGQFLSQAGQQQGNLAAQNAQLSTQANIARGQGQAGLYGQGANIASNLAGQGAGMFSNAGNIIGQGRLQTGRDLANQISNTSSALSNLTNQQGGGLSDIIGQGGSNLANLLSGSGQFNSQQQTNLAQLLSNLATQSGSQIANANQQIGQAQAGGIMGKANAIGGTIGDIAGGIGSGGFQKGMNYLSGLF